MTKPPKRLASIDLNLLVVYDAIMRERSITRAGRLVGLSQPAISHALSRLRHALGDELFIRSPKGMEPTPRAEQLENPIRFVLDGLEKALEPDQFDPSGASTTFSVAVDNYAAIVMVPAIAKRVATLAPNVTLDFRPSGTLDVLDQLDRSELHLSIGSTNPTAERISRRLLTQDKFVLVLRKGNPAVQARNFPTDKLASLRMLEISSAQFGVDFAEPGGKASKRKWVVAMRAPFLSAAGVLASSDLVSMVPLSVAKSMLQSKKLTFMHMSRPPDPLATSMAWLRRLDNQPAHAWLRDVITKVVRDLHRPTN